jgi:hypothetical protein
VGGSCASGSLPQTAPYDWSTYRQLSGVDRRVASSLAKAAKEQGADPRLWYVSFEPVRAFLWVAVEVWQDGTWLSYRADGGPPSTTEGA